MIYNFWVLDVVININCIKISVQFWNLKKRNVRKIRDILFFYTHTVFFMIHRLCASAKYKLNVPMKLADIHQWWEKKKSDMWLFSCAFL